MLWNSLQLIKSEACIAYLSFNECALPNRKKERERERGRVIEIFINRDREKERQRK